MKAPKIPSFFKTSESKKFSFKARYYDEKKERREQLLKTKQPNKKFHRSYIKNKQKGKKLTIILLIIILSLLAFKFITNLPYLH